LQSRRSPAELNPHIDVGEGRFELPSPKSTVLQTAGPPLSNSPACSVVKDRRRPLGRLPSGFGQRLFQQAIPTHLELPRGFEPPTRCLQNSCAAPLRHGSISSEKQRTRVLASSPLHPGSTYRPLARQSVRRRRQSYASAYAATVVAVATISVTIMPAPPSRCTVGCLIRVIQIRVRSGKVHRICINRNSITK
jgi:hypothetical protein